MMRYADQLTAALAFKETATCTRPTGHETQREAALCPKHFCTCSNCLASSPFAVEAGKTEGGA